VPYFVDWNLAELSGYVGLLPLMLAAFGVIARLRKSVAWFWVAVGLFALVLVLGDQTPFAKVMYALPGFNKFQAQARHFVEFTMAVSTLAGLGVAAIKNRTVTTKPMAVVVTTLGSIMLLSFGVTFWRAETLAALAIQKGIASLPMLPWSNPALGIPFVVFGLSAVTLVMWLREPASALRTLLLLVSLAVDLGSFGWFCEWKLLSRHRGDFRAPDIARVYRSTLEANHQRIAPVRGAKDFSVTSLGMQDEIPPNLQRLWGVPSVGGYGPLPISRVSETLSMLHNGEITGHWYRPEDRTFDIIATSLVSVPMSAFRPLSTRDQRISWPVEDVGIWLGAECGTKRAQDSSRLGVPEPVKATALGVVSFIGCGPAIPDNTEVVSVVITDEQGGTHRHGIRAGRDTSEWALDCADVLPDMRHRRAPVFLSFPVSREGAGPCPGHWYVSTLGFEREIDVRALELAWTGQRAGISIQKLTLYNNNSGLSYPVSELPGFLSDASRWRLDQEIGGTRVYENVRAMPRVWLVSETLTLKPDQVLAALKTSRLPDGRSFDPAQIGLVEEPLELKGEADATKEAVVQRITGTEVEVRTRSSAVAFLVGSDVFYPGWSVTVDDAPARLYQTNYILRGVVVPAGEHLVKFRFTPRTFYAGLGVTGLCAAVTIGISVISILSRHRIHHSRERGHAVER
jgi:hypothetical protein